VDVLGAGFGPAGIALACAVEDLAEASGGPPLGRVRFLERATEVAWHPGMLLRETDIQHHFLRDLATPRSPRSRFTFVNYLHERGRLYEFGELLLGAAGGAVSRLEWSDYLRWAAGQLAGYVRYGTEVVAARPLGRDRLAVETSDGTVAARALVLSSGRAPHVPPELAALAGPTAFHSSAFLTAVDGLDRDAALRFAVVGSGESAVEVLAHLHATFPRARLVSVHRTLGFRHVDLCQFSNEVFHPGFVDRFHALGPAARRAVLAEARPTNFGVVDAQAADVLYRRLYEDLVVGVRRVDVLTSRRVVGASTVAGTHRLVLEHLHTGEREEVAADVVVLCTGYREDVFPAALAPLAEMVATDEDGGPVVGRDYRVATTGGLDAPVYLCGTSERTHGPSDGASFSMVALRAGTVVESLLTRLGRRSPAPRGGSAARPAS
jgi:L-ornithine N5-oxygenase